MNRGSRSLSVALLSALVALPAAAIDVLQLDLAQICDRAGRIFRGTVVDVREGRIAAGGGQIPTTTYVFRVDEAFKGTFSEAKGEQYATVQMIGPFKQADQGNVRRLSDFTDMPRFERGRPYLVMFTSPSSGGLSSPVGLAQGAFKISGRPGAELATNGANNLGLIAGSASGPMSYAALASQIRSLVGK